MEAEIEKPLILELETEMIPVPALHGSEQETETLEEGQSSEPALFELRDDTEEPLGLELETAIERPLILELGTEIVEAEHVHSSEQTAGSSDGSQSSEPAGLTLDLRTAIEEPLILKLAVETEEPLALDLVVGGKQ
jgi:hypothetical protein